MADDDLIPTDDGSDEKKKRKKAEKARGVWISFAGRIIAQIVGAGASVALGVMVLQRYQAPPSPASTEAPPQAAVVPARATSTRPGEASLAVLPLDNLSKNADQEYFVDGMTEALIAGLANVEGLRVISRTSTARYKTEQRSIPEVAQALGVDLVVEGSVLQAGNQVRITAQLIDGRTDEHLWAQSYSRRLDDVIQLQDAVATAIASAIKGTVSRRPGSRAGTHTRVDAAAYDLYLRGRHAWFMRTPESLKMSADYFTQAIARDPAFALAHVGLADTLALGGSPTTGFGDASARTARAKASAMRALELDPNLAEAHTALAGVLFFGERDMPGAEAALRRAIDLNPNYPVAHEWLGILLGETGRDTEAMEQAELAVRLDPLEATMYQARGMLHYNARRLAEAIASEQRALVLQPSLPLARALLVKAQVLAGDPRRALSTCFEATPDDYGLLVACAGAAHRAGEYDRVAALKRALAQRKPAVEAVLAQVEAVTGDVPFALRRLQTLAASHRVPPSVAVDPFFDELRAHPQWAAVAASSAPGRASPRSK